MRRRILSAIIRTIYRHPGATTAFLLLVTGILGFFAGKLRVNFDWTGFLPQEAPPVAASRLIARLYPTSFDTIMVALQTETDPPQQRLLMEAAEKLAAEFLKAPDMVAGIDYKIDDDTRHFFATLTDPTHLALMDDAEWGAIAQDLKVENFRLPLLRAWTRLQTPFLPGGANELDPLGMLDRMRTEMVPRFGPMTLPQHGGYAISPDGKILVMSVKPAQPASNIVDAHLTVRFLEKTVRDVFKDKRNKEIRGKVFASFAGSHVDVTRANQYFRDDLQYYILPVGIALMLLLFVVVFRKVEAMFYVSIPVAFGIVWTLGLAGLAYGEITVAAMIFLIVSIALGFEFTLHVYSRFIDELYRSKNYPRSLETAYLQTGRGIWTSAAAGALVFATLCLAPYEGLRQLGAVAALGVICGWLSNVLVLPAMIAIKAHRRRERVNPVYLPPLGLDRVAGTVAGYPRATLAMGFLLTAYFGYWALDLEYRDTPAPSAPFTKDASWASGVDENFYRAYPKGLDVPAHPILAAVSSPDLQVALLKNDRLYENLRRIQEKYRIISVDSMRQVLPSIETQRAFRRRIAGLDVDAVSESLKNAGKQQGYSRDAFTPLLAVLQSARALPENDLFLEYKPEQEEPEALDRAVRRYLAWTDPGNEKPRIYTVVTTLYPGKDSLHGKSLMPFLIEARQGIQGVEFTGDALLNRVYLPGFQQALARSALAAILVVAFVLAVHFHSGWKILAVLAPTACVMIWFLGSLALLDIHLHFYTLIVLPLPLIFSIDHNLHFLQLYSERRDMWPSLALVGRAMLTTSLSVMVGLGPLVFAEYDGLHDLGLAILFGNALALLGSVTLLPATIRLQELKAGLGALAGVDEGLGKSLEDF